MPFKAVRDPIHGFIQPNARQADLIDTVEFQRLRGISQLALTYLVYPGARHSRFELNLLRRRKSSFIHGAEDDARVLSEHLVTHLAVGARA